MIAGKEARIVVHVIDRSGRDYTIPLDEAKGRLAERAQALNQVGYGSAPVENEAQEGGREGE